MPRKLIVFGDNTVRELKNQFVLDYLANLTASRKMRLASTMFLRKSHTHDRIDQLWGVLARRISSTDTLLNASDAVRIVQEEISRPGVRAWLGATTELHVQKLDACRDWKSSWKPQGVTLSGGLLEDARANHVFFMMARKGGVIQKKQVLESFHVSLNFSLFIF